MRSSLKPWRSPSTVSDWRKPPICGSGVETAAPPLLKLPPQTLAVRPSAPAARWITWMTPTNEVAPYITGAAPRRISMRSTLLRSRLGRAGLKAPPQGTPSTTSRKASNSRRPQISGTELAGPFSPPGATATPAASASAEGRSRAPRAAMSSPEITVTEAGTVSTSSGVRVAVTWMVSVTTGVAGGSGLAWANGGKGDGESRGTGKAADELAKGACENLL